MSYYNMLLTQRCTREYTITCLFDMHDANAAVNTAVVRHQPELKWR